MLETGEELGRGQGTGMGEGKKKELGRMMRGGGGREWEDKAEGIL